MSEKQLRRIAEIQSPTSSFRRAKRHEFNSGQILDLELGDDLLSEPVRQSVLTYLQHERPGLVIIYSFRARPDQLFNLSRSFLEKDHGHMKKHIDHRKKGRRLLEFAVQVGQLCSKLGLKFAVDCPWPQRSWQTRCLHPLLAASGAECVRYGSGPPRSHDSAPDDSPADQSLLTNAVTWSAEIQGGAGPKDRRQLVSLLNRPYAKANFKDVKESRTSRSSATRTLWRRIGGLIGRTLQARRSTRSPIRPRPPRTHNLRGGDLP